MGKLRYKFTQWLESGRAGIQTHAVLCRVHALNQHTITQLLTFNAYNISLSMSLNSIYMQCLAKCLALK